MSEMSDKSEFLADQYQSSIPEDALERVTERYWNRQKKRAEYVLKGEVVGVRYFFDTGEVEDEYALKNAVKHGVEYHWRVPGKLLSATPYIDGREHGTATQWSDDGAFIGAYTMEYGTGLDLWWQYREDGSAYLSEARYVKDGDRHGFEWWIDWDQTSV